MTRFDIFLANKEYFNDVEMLQSKQNNGNMDGNGVLLRTNNNQIWSRRDLQQTGTKRECRTRHVA